MHPGEELAQGWGILKMNSELRSWRNDIHDLEVFSPWSQFDCSGSVGRGGKRGGLLGNPDLLLLQGF